MGLRHRWDRLTLGPRTGRVQGEWINERLTGISLGIRPLPRASCLADLLVHGKSPSSSGAAFGSMTTRHGGYSMHAWERHASVASCTVSHAPQCKRVTRSLTHGPGWATFLVPD